MSVLFKALAKAAKTREAVTGTAAPVGQPAILNRGGSSSGGSKRLLMLIGALVIGVAGGSYLFFMTGDDAAPVARQAPRPRVPVIQTPAAQPAAAPAPVATTQPAPTAQAVPAPSPIAAENPPTAQPAPVVAMAAAPAPSPEPIKPTAAAPAAPSGVVKPKPQAPVMAVEEDLPTLLARLRRQRAEGAISQPVSVARSGSRRDLVDDEGRTAIQVGVAPQAGVDAAHAGYDALLQGRYEEALDNYNRALATEPRSSALLLGKATALQKLGRTDDARRAYNTVLAVDRNNLEALTNLTTLMAEQSPERALADLRALRQTNPNFSPIEAEIGAQEAALGDVAASIEALSHAVALSPGNGLYRLNLAILQDRAELRADAAASYRAALDLLSARTTGLPLPVDQIRRRLAYLEGR